MSDTTIICCAEIEDPGWRWLETNLAVDGVRMEFSRCVPNYALEKRLPFNLARLRGSFEAVRLARRTGAKALVTHGPTIAAWCALFARALGVQVPIIAHSFNFTELPTGAKRAVFSLALSRIDQFVVFSKMERKLYADAFALPIDRFGFVHWGVLPPKLEAPETPFEQGDYVSAIGGNARDYRTLMEVARHLPDISFVLVVRPHSLEGLDVPPNVKVHINLPLGDAMNVLHHSRFMVLPLINSDVPCGHVTLVAAMHLGKAFVITDSTGVSDYVRNGENALTGPTGSVEVLTAATKRLWENPILCARLAENGRNFATRECTEERIAEHFRQWLRVHNLLTIPANERQATMEPEASTR